MKKTLLIFEYLMISLIGYGQEDFYCNRDYEIQDSMSRAWYPFQIVDSIRFQDSKTFIVADDHIKPINFISSEEKIYKSLADASKELSKIVSSQAVSDSINIVSAFWDSLARKEHLYANNLDMAVWIQNKTNDTILFPKQDGSLIGLIEALDANIEWKPIEYWWFNGCGNSFSDLILLPEQSIQIGLNNKRGEIKTKMRLRIHGLDTIYLSNEFIGTVSRDNFILNSKTKYTMIKDLNRISFLDSVFIGLTDEPIFEIIDDE